MQCNVLAQEKELSEIQIKHHCFLVTLRFMLAIVYLSAWLKCFDDNTLQKLQNQHI